MNLNKYISILLTEISKRQKIQLVTIQNGIDGKVYKKYNLKLEDNLNWIEFKSKRELVQYLMTIK